MRRKRLNEIINHGGEKIAPREVDDILLGHDSVAQAVTFAVPDPTLGEAVAAAVVLRDGAAISAAELRAFAARQLADFKEALPVGPTGKVDRTALPPPDVAHTSEFDGYGVPRTETERRLARIWEELLGVPRVGITDDFFALGGHSLLALRLGARLEAEFGSQIPMSALFRGATIEQLAKRLDRPTSGFSSLVPIQPHGKRRPLFCVHEFFGDVVLYERLARQLGDDQPFWGLQPPGIDGALKPASDIGKMAARYIEAMRSVQPEGPYSVGGLCAGGLVALEMAQQLRAAGHEVALVALLDSAAWSFVPAAERQASGHGWVDFMRDMPHWLAGLRDLTARQWRDVLRLKVGLWRKTLARNPPGQGYGRSRERSQDQRHWDSIRSVAPAEAAGARIQGSAPRLPAEALCRAHGVVPCTYAATDRPSRPGQGLAAAGCRRFPHSHGAWQPPRHVAGASCGRARQGTGGRAGRCRAGCPLRGRRDAMMGGIGIHVRPDAARAPDALGSLTIDDGVVDTWCFSLQASTADVDLLRERLSAGEQRRAVRFRFERHRRRFIVGRAITRGLLGRYIDEPPGKLMLGEAPHGKPVLQKAGARLRFNLSHTGDVMLIAVANGFDVGIDVEAIDNSLDHTALAERSFAPGEIAMLRNTHPARRATIFSSIWTLKEAFVKATGTGLSARLDTFDVRRALSAGRRPFQIESPSHAGEWWAQQTCGPAGCTAAVVAAGTFRLRVRTARQSFPRVQGKEVPNGKI